MRECSKYEEYGSCEEWVKRNESELMEAYNDDSRDISFDEYCKKIWQGMY